MRANVRCLACLLDKQERRIRNQRDEEKKGAYIHRALEILWRHGQEESAPWLGERLDELYEEFWGTTEDYTQIKRGYNQLMLEKEPELEQRIRRDADPLKECLKYVCAANYIDFSAVEHVNERTLEKLLEKAESETVPEDEYGWFARDLEKAESLAYLTDNCGEIVLDKLLVRLLKERYPHLAITVILRGKEVLNDATMEDAAQTGLTELVPCMGNGSGAPGTVRKELSEAAARTLDQADLIIAKGQGNFESLYGEGLNPYYLFLCKCGLFVDRFGLKQYESVFRREERMGI